MKAATGSAVQVVNVQLEEREPNTVVEVRAKQKDVALYTAFPVTEARTSWRSRTLCQHHAVHHGCDRRQTAVQRTRLRKQQPCSRNSAMTERSKKLGQQGHC